MRTLRFDLYARLREHPPEILVDAEVIAREIGIPDDWRGDFGISASNSSRPGVLRQKVVDAIAGHARTYAPLTQLGDELRRVVKSVYGDDYDAALVNRAEAGLAVACDALIAPSLAGRGVPHRARCIVPLERHAEHHGSYGRYGRPFPGRYKDLSVDRGATAGELGLAGRRAGNADIVLVRLPGARFDVHGIKSYPCPLLTAVDPAAALTAYAHVAAIHAYDLAGFVTLAYDTRGYGYGAKDGHGVPLIQQGVGRLAARHGVPYVAGNAWGLPFHGTDPRRIGADVTLYGVDKVAGVPTAGRVVGRVEAMVNIRRALGLHGERYGTVSAHGKPGHVAFDPGKEALAGSLAALRLLRDEPETVLAPFRDPAAIVADEFARVAGRFKPGVVVNPSRNAGGAEVNYEATWSDDQWGIPVFSHEDRIAQTNLVNIALARIGVVPSLADDGNLLVTPGPGTVDDDGRVIEPRPRLARATFRALLLVQDWAKRLA